MTEKLNNMAKKKVKKGSFKDVWKFPLHQEFNKVFTKDIGMAFDFMDRKFTAIDRAAIVDCLNFEDVESPLPPSTQLVYADGDIYYTSIEDKNRIITIRGWGHLTGTGGLELSAKRAAELQDEFAAYIIKRLSYCGEESI